MGIGSFINNFGVREFTINDTYELDRVIPPFTLHAPEGTIQRLVITAESFDTILRTPSGDETSSHKDESTLEWVHDQNNVSILELTNTGPGSLHISGTVYSETDWIFITYNFFIMITGLVIIGFSAGFGRRKPRGF